MSLLEKTAEDALSTLEEDGRNDHVRTQQEVDHLQARKKAFTRNQIKQNFDLEFLATSIVRNKFLLFKPLSLWYFVMTAQATTGQCKKEILDLYYYVSLTLKIISTVSLGKALTLVPATHNACVIYSRKKEWASHNSKAGRMPIPLHLVSMDCNIL